MISDLLVNINSQCLGMNLSVLVLPWREIDYPSGSSYTANSDCQPHVVIYRWAEERSRRNCAVRLTWQELTMCHLLTLSNRGNGSLNKAGYIYFSSSSLVSPLAYLWTCSGLFLDVSEHQHRRKSSRNLEQSVESRRGPRCMSTKVIIYFWSMSLYTVGVQN